MKLLWKVKLDSQPREMHNLFSPLIADRVTTARGAREVAIVAGISDDLFGIDVASGELLWKKRYESTFAPTDKTVYHTLCLGGQTACRRWSRSHRANTRSTRSGGTGGFTRSTPPTAPTSPLPTSSCLPTASPMP